MQHFAALYEALDASTATNDKLAALVQHLGQAAPDDAAWAVYVLAGGRPRQLVPVALLREAACRQAGVDEWLFEACYQAVGDLAETIAHILPGGPHAPDGGAQDIDSAGSAAGPAPAEHAPGADAAERPEAADTACVATSAGRAENGLAYWMTERLLPLRGLPPATQLQRVLQAFGELDAAGRFLLVKLIGGGFRVGVSRLLVQRALARLTGLEPALLAQRLVGWTDAKATPSAARWHELVAPAGQGVRAPGQPYPFFLAHALQEPPATLGPVQDWLVEWKYDGIRAQVVKRQGQVWVWSRGEELVTERFPEVVARAAQLPDGTVLDGELLAWHEGEEHAAPFKLLQQRINRKTVGKKLLADAPVAFMAYDLLEDGGQDLRAQPQQQRRAALLQRLARGPFSCSPAIEVGSWEEAAALRQQSRQRGVEGFMLKHLQARYGSGRTKADGLWWKWKVEPLTVDAVLVYAQAGHGRRASVYTDYTFAVWSRPPDSAAEAQAVVAAIARREPPPPAGSEALRLLPFAKAYSGLSDAEFKAVDQVVRANTLEKFGPVRSVRPTLVFEIGFEGIGASPRHKSGVAVRFPRMLRLRADKPLHEADTLATLQALIQGEAPV